ncbi:MAG: putative type-4 fimbrial biosis protein precursor [Gammaproteobacteria bacterium]|nr:putative type-4 fimbrial biosis protein precursor [Gammaproteobacteria bacterium]
MNYRKYTALLAISLATALPVAAWAQVTVGDDFTLASDTNDWVTSTGACLTAGDGTGKIPACVGLPYYQQKGAQTLVGGTSGVLPDKKGEGALRFTNGYTSGIGGFIGGYNQTGSIISNFTFDAGAGISVIFKTVTYRGDSGGSGADGADGISFFLIDGSFPPYDTGALGGSLGYSCTNQTGNNDTTVRADGTVRGFDGLLGGYLGLGIDEYGNFLNQSDNTSTGYGLVPDRIGLRGRGNISWKGLNGNSDSNIAKYYPSSLSVTKRALAVQKTCSTGTLWDYTNATPTDTKIEVPDYNVIPNAYKVLSATPTPLQIANEKAKTRDQTQPLASRAIPIAYKLKITQDGLLTFSYSYNGGSYLPVITGQSITASNGTLPAKLRFGFAGSTGGSNNIHEILCFQATPADLASTSVGVNEKEAAKIANGTQAYLALYFPSDWTGRLTANDLTYDPTTQLVGVAAKANWDASCNLTGATSPKGCATTGASSVTVQAPAKRVILSWNGTSGIPFQYASLTGTQQTTITQGDAAKNTPDRVNYLRGDRTKEINSSGVGLFRARDSVLGDIIDSSPTWVGPPNSP